jgi:hypothetical protein
MGRCPSAMVLVRSFTRWFDLEHQRVVQRCQSHPEAALGLRIQPSLLGPLGCVLLLKSDEREARVERLDPSGRGPS